MAGRFAYWMIGGAAVIGGMIVQGDIRLNEGVSDVELAKSLFRGDERTIDREIDRAVDRQVADVTVRHEDERVAVGSAAENQLADAVSELVRAEGGLISARLDHDLPAAAIEQAQQRRNFARQAVERLSADARAAGHDNRDAMQARIRQTVRDAVRS